MDAVILAGGLGTRLRDVVADRPKVLAPINGIPFLDIILNQLENTGRVDRIIMAVGYKKEMIQDHLKNRPFPIIFSEEEEPLGTGGALKKALKQVRGYFALVLNGDTFVNFSLDEFYAFHEKNGADLSLLCLPNQDENRYGTIELSDEGRVLSFSEKIEKKGKISGGIYLIQKNLLDSFPDIFSLEKEGFPHLLKKKVFGFSCSPFFIDIGTISSYALAQKVL